MGDNEKRQATDTTDVLREELASQEESIEERCEREEWEQTVAEAMWSERASAGKDST